MCKVVSQSVLDLIVLSCLTCVNAGRVGRSSVTEKLEPKDVTSVMDGSIRTVSFRVDQKVGRILSEQAIPLDSIMSVCSHTYIHDHTISMIYMLSLHGYRFTFRC